MPVPVRPGEWLGLAGGDVGERATGGVRGVDALCGLPVSL